MLLLSLTACLGTSPYGDDVLPLEEQIRINLPVDDAAAAKTASDPAAEWATFYQLTRSVTEDVNGMVGFVLGTVGFVVTLRPAWVDEEEHTAMWGPYADSGLDPVETGLFVTRNADRSYTWTLFQLPKGGDVEADSVAIVAGEVDTGSTHRDASGRFVVDFDTAAAMDPAVDLVGTFAVDYDYDADGVAGVAAFDDYGVRGAAPVDALYAYSEDYAGAGSMDLARLEDVTAAGVEELGTMRSRWEADGQGRSDAKVTGGSLDGEVTASECWGADFSRVFWTDTAGISPNEGDVGACAFSDPEYATEASFVPVD
jgi:hypothetical protein